MSDLDQLDSVAAAADAGAAAADGVAVQDAGQALQDTGPNYGGEAAGAVDMFTSMLVGYAPATASIWTDEAKARTAAALAPVMEKYGFSFGSLPPEITLLVVAGPLVWQSSRVVAAQMEADKAKAAQVAAPKHPAPYIDASKMPQDRPPAPERHPQEKLYTTGGA